MFSPNDYCERLNTFEFCELMSTLKLKTLKTLCLFIDEIYESVCPLRTFVHFSLFFPIIYSVPLTIYLNL